MHESNDALIIKITIHGNNYKTKIVLVVINKEFITHTHNTYAHTNISTCATHTYKFLLEDIYLIHITETVLWHKHTSQLNHIDSEMCFHCD